MSEGSGAPARVAVCETIPVERKPLALTGGEICDHLKRRGFDCDFVNGSDWWWGDWLLREPRYDLVVFPHCEVFALPVMEKLTEYLKAGGRMLMIGGRPFERLAVRGEDGRWLTLDQFDEMRSRTEPEKVFARFTNDERRVWRRASGSPKHTTKVSTEPSGNEEIGPALRVDVANFESWDVVTREFETSPLADDPRLLTCFWARGSRDLPQLSVEWEERDGSRWIAVVDLTPEWLRYALPIDRFEYWQDSRGRGRGGAGDAFKPANARRLAFGLGYPHTTKVTKRADHTYWIADVGWARDTLPRYEATPPTLEILSPLYKTYRTYTTYTSYQKAPPPRLRAVHPALGGGEVAASSTMVLPVARRTGACFDPARRYRWIPLVEAVGGSGDTRGAPVSVLVGRSGPFAKSAWGYVGIPEDMDRTALRFTMLGWVGDTAAFLLRGLWLTQGGAREICYFQDEPWTFGVEVANRSNRASSVTVVTRSAGASLARPSTGGVIRAGLIIPGFRRTFRLEPGQLESAVVRDFSGPTVPALLGVDVLLRHEGRTIDRVTQYVRVIPRSRKRDPKRLVRVEGGDFVVDGKPWVPFGINFWPRDVTGIEDFNYWNKWLSPGFYNPERTRRDLERVREFGMNVVCVQYYDEGQARSLIDFLEQCRELDLRAFIYLPGSFPLRPNPKRLQRRIRAAHLHETDAVFAYDVAWEPRVGHEQQRRAYDAAWRYWIDERYGGIEYAEKDWGFAAPRDKNGRAIGPPDRMILSDGPHRVMVAAYRRFIDDLISLGYGRVARAIREVDPHRLIGVRSGWGGTGSAWGDAEMPFDLASGARHLDFISPEGYGHGPRWETVRNAGLTTLYGRLVGGGKPVWWAEYGMSVHPQPDEKTLARQGEMYANFARMFVESRANGGAGWWFPGGFRVGEDSDFGIFNPDGTPRPAALANREWAERVAAIRAPADKADVVITVDRDLHPRGYSQIRARHEKEYLDAVEAGKTVALRTEGTGTNSANTPLVAVGNRPYNGHNPTKYLNAEFERFWIRIGDAGWREVEFGEAIELPRGARILGRAQVANTAEAAWLPPTDPRAAKAGGVYLVSTRTSDLPVRAPLPKETPFLGDCTFEEFVITNNADRSASISLELEAATRARFGQHWCFQLSVR